MESDPSLRYAVYVEKFDEKNEKVKVDLKVWQEIQSNLFNVFLQESSPVKNQLFEECEKRFDSDRGEVLFLPKSEFAQDFLIKSINCSLQIPGLKARRPMIETRVSFDAFFFKL